VRGPYRTWGYLVPDRGSAPPSFRFLFDCKSHAQKARSTLLARMMGSCQVVQGSRLQQRTCCCLVDNPTYATQIAKTTCIVTQNGLSASLLKETTPKQIPWGFFHRTATFREHQIESTSVFLLSALLPRYLQDTSLRLLLYI